MVALCEANKQKDVKVHQPWKKNVMIVNTVVPVTGVPFINSTRAIKTLTLVERTSTQFVLEVDTKTIDAPYSDTFSCKELWIVMSQSEKQQKSILIRKQKIAFVKYTMFKSKIQARAEEGQA